MRPHCGSVCGQTFVGAKNVGDDHIAGHQSRGKAAFDPGIKGTPVDRPVRKGRSGGLYATRCQFRREGAHCQVRLVSASHSPASNRRANRPPVLQSRATRDLISIESGEITLLPIIW